MASFIEEIRSIRQRALESSSKVLDVPGYGGRIAIRYIPTGRETLGDVLAASQRGEALSKDDELQLLVDCCDEILKREGDPDDEPVPYDDSGTPLAFNAGDERWLELVGTQPRTARECVELLFMLDQQPLATARHAGSLVDWMNGLERELAARVEGKPSTGPGSAGP
jgi:hypothetical protein